MATAEDLMRILEAIRDSNELSRSQMKDLSEAIVKKGNGAQKKWYDVVRYKPITAFGGGKSEVWEERQTMAKIVIKSGDNELMEVITYAEMKCSEATLKQEDCYEAMVDGSGREK